MIRDNFNDLFAFVIVAQERSFTKAAAKLGVTQSALSQTIRSLEERLNIRLLARTTRSVSPTDAGEKLMLSLEQNFSEISSHISELSIFKDTPAGNIRLTCGEHAFDSAVSNKLAKFISKYPDIHVEVNIDNTLTNIVDKRFDAGVRMGDMVEKDMIGIPIGPPLRMAVVGSPDYFTRYEIPTHPKDLLEQSCLNFRLPTTGGNMIWEFENSGQVLNIRPKGQLTFNTYMPLLQAALSGLGLAYLTDDVVEEYVSRGELVKVLEDWCQPFPGYYLYYPSRKQPLYAFKLLMEALRNN
ncbi:LysR family transcriptional regulator [Vibrio fluvialis]|nr:LysR family transcriptional regulator [Vibrio fluvialis]